MEAVLKKWGNSVAVRLPSPLLKEAGVRVNQSVELRSEGGAIIISKKVKPVRYKLSALVAEITDENRHESIEFGRPVGREAL